MSERARRRAQRLARLYPRPWRARFPDFVETLAAELDEGTRGVGRDVARAALAERLRHAGALPAGSADGARSGLALVYAALVPFAVLATGMWSQLRTGIAGRGPAVPAVLRGADLVLAASAVVATVVLPVGVVVGALRRRSRGTAEGAAPTPALRPALVSVASLVVLSATGWSADRSGWYSPAAAALPRTGPAHLLTLWVRGGVAAITPAWVHPDLVARMPAGELLAAAVAPVALVGGAGGVLRLLARLPARAPRRADTVLGLVTAGTMLAAVAASARWLAAHPTRQGATARLARTDQLAPGHAGWVTVAVLGALAVIAVVGVRRVLRAGPDRPRRAGSGAGALRPDAVARSDRGSRAGAPSLRRGRPGSPLAQLVGAAQAEA
ncbi:MAG TPA: hypothetical protein VMB72_01365 [Acidimicrobiales bacterium]|nr:hypothetical protein [Acidimicrobiales bacterium]